MAIKCPIPCSTVSKTGSATYVPGKEIVWVRHLQEWLVVKVGIVLTCLTFSAAVQAQSPPLPPPRTVADVFELLNRQSLSAELAQAKELLSRKVPLPDASKSVQIAFFAERASAAARLGHISAAIEARTRIVELGQGERNLPKHLIDLAVNEMTAGNWSRANEYVRKAVNAPTAAWGQDIAANILAARMQSFFGDTSSARTQTDFVDALIRRGSQNIHALGFADLANALLGWAKADTLLADGDGLAGERALRSAYTHALADTKVAARRSRSVEFAPAEDFTWQLLDLIQTQLARLHLRQGRLQEAELVAREMITRNASRYGRLSPSTALSLATLGEVVAAVSG